MYLPKHFEETRLEVLHGLIRAYPLGALVTLTAGGLDANHIPFEIDPDPRPFDTLRGHVGRAKPVWREPSPGAQALVIFQGPDTYLAVLVPTKSESGSRGRSRTPRPTTSTSRSEPSSDSRSRSCS